MNQHSLSYIKGISFAPFHRRGSLDTQIARDSLDYMISHTSADFIVLAPVGLQDDAHSEEICYTSAKAQSVVTTVPSDRTPAVTSEAASIATMSVQSPTSHAF